MSNQTDHPKFPVGGHSKRLNTLGLVTPVVNG